MTVCFATLGCKVNQYDTQAMLEQFVASGYEPASPGAKADIYVINTCTVTGAGDQKSMKLVRRCHRCNPMAELVIAGCLAQRMGEELRYTGARLILGTQYRGRVVELLERAMAENTQTVAVSRLDSAPYEALSIRGHQGHTRAVVKIQEGCDCQCSYCVIPSVRGGVRSRPLESIREEAAALGRAGFVELVLTGIHLTSYGKDLPGRPGLAEAVEAACGRREIRRIRLGSLEPGVADDAFLKAMRKLPAFCPQFHLALQSGSDRVLSRMRRRYDTAQFEAAVRKIRAAYENAAITSDVMVGFPGETEAEFRETLAFCQRIGFAKTHVFPFSPREGTPAAAMPGQIPEAVRRERARCLIRVGEELAEAYRLRQLGGSREVLLEEQRPDGTWEGYTPEYVHTLVEDGKTCGRGRIVPVRMERLTREGIAGAVVE